MLNKHVWLVAFLLSVINTADRLIPLKSKSDHVYSSPPMSPLRVEENYYNGLQIPADLALAMSPYCFSLLISCLSLLHSRCHMLLFDNAKHNPTSGPLHMLLSLLDCFFSTDLLTSPHLTLCLMVTLIEKPL